MRVYYGIGAESLLKDRLKAFAQINRESGRHLKTDFQIKVGLKYLFWKNRDASGKVF